MRKTLPLFVTFLFCTYTYAQTPITITGADLPRAGKAFILANDTAASMTISAAGSSQQIWNFTSLTDLYPKAAVYDSTSSTHYASQFPTSNIYTYGPSAFFGALYGGAPVASGANGYTFWKSDTAGLRVIGWEAVNGAYANMPIHESRPELLIGTPATYGTSFADTSHWSLVLGGPGSIDTAWVNNRTKTLTVDAWGSLTTPFGSFPNVLRIHENVTETDSVIATFNSTVVFQMEVRRTISNNYMFLANGIGYPLVTIQADSNNHINNVEYMIDTACAVYSKVMGMIANDSGNVINSGMAYLYQYIDSLTPMQLIDSTVIDSNGAYIFLHITGGNYIVSAQASLTSCPSCIATYSGNANFWLNGMRFDSYCLDTILSNIILTQLPQLAGNAFLSGLIQYGLGTPKTESTSMPAIGILLEQLPGGIKAHTTSDASGNYSFSKIPSGTYKLSVDVPGLPMVSTYTVTVTAVDSSFTNLNFTVDTVAHKGGIYAGYPLSNTDIKPAQVSVYPNPSDGRFSISLESIAAGPIEIKMYNTLGQIVYEQNTNTNKNILVEGIASGIYTLQIRTGNEFINKKVVVKK